METSSSPTRPIELKRLVADRFRSKGYEVYVDPPASLLPDFMIGYRPDIVALKGDDRVVIEVKTARPGSTDPRLKGLADVFRHPDSENWRLEVHYASDSPSSLSAIEPMQRRDMETMLDQAKELSEAGYQEASLLFGWAALEAIARFTVIDSDNMLGRPLGPRQLVSAMETMGTIDPEQAQVLRRLGDRRNAIAHGAQTPGTTMKSETQELLAIASSVLRG